MFKANGKNCSLLGQLETTSDSPRLFGRDPIVRYFPPTASAAAVEEVPNADDTAELDDSDDDVCFGPITFKELRKASILVKNRWEVGRRPFKSPPSNGRIRLIRPTLVRFLLCKRTRMPHMMVRLTFTIPSCHFWSEIYN